MLEAVQAFIASCHEWHGTATELLEILQDSLDPDIKPNTLSRRLNASASKLEQDYGVDYRTSRKQEGRIIHLSEIHHDDNDANDDIPEIAAAP